VRVMLGCRVMLTSIFSLPEDFGTVEVADEFEAGFYERAGFAFRFGDFGDVVYLILEELLGELNVD